MNMLKEKDSKFYQECDVVMLVTDKTSKIGLYTDKINTKLYQRTHETPLIGTFIPLHFYFLSNEKIKKGDWCYREYIGIFQCKEKPSVQSSWGKKIVATTDLTLGCSGDSISHLFPQPSKEFIQAFIKSYNEGKPITKVLVEMTKMWTTFIDGDITESTFDYKLKINPSSLEITIKKIKNDYTREEVIAFGLKCVDLGMDLNNNPLPRLNEVSGKEFYYNWLENNL